MKILFAMILAVMVVQGADFSARDFGAKGVRVLPKGTVIRFR